MEGINSYPTGVSVSWNRDQVAALRDRYGHTEACDIIAGTIFTLAHVDEMVRRLLDSTDNEVTVISGVGEI